MEQGTMGKRISALRKRAGLTQDALAKQLGLSAQAVSKWENDLSCPDITLLPQLAKILGVTTDRLLGVDEVPDAGEAVEASVEPIEDGEEPEGHGAVFSVESDGDQNFEVRIDPPGGLNLTGGIFVILTGVLMLLGRFLGGEPIGFWKSLLLAGMVVFGARDMIRKINFFNTLLFSGGVFFALSDLSLIHVELDWDVMMPVLVVLFGAFLLLESFKRYRRRRTGGSKVVKIGRKGAGAGSKAGTWSSADGWLDYSQAFGEGTCRVDAREFQGGKVDVSFGEYTIDFSGVESVAPGCRVEVNVAFGEATIRAPKHYRVELSPTVNFSEVEVEGSHDPMPRGVIGIDANVAFGHLEIEYLT